MLVILRDWVLQTGYLSSSNPQVDSSEAIEGFLQVFSRLDVQASAFNDGRIYYCQMFGVELYP
jgi:hypothetical protein